MNIINGRGVQLVAETETLPRPHFDKDGCFAGSLKEANRTTITTEHLINVMKDCVRMNQESSGFDCEIGTWLNRCYREILWRLEEMEEKAI
jgi:hypothetical protein